MAIKRKDGYEEFLKRADEWKGPHEKAGSRIITEASIPVGSDTVLYLIIKGRSARWRVACVWVA
jgi:hypothetical protein